MGREKCFGALRLPAPPHLDLAPPHLFLSPKSAPIYICCIAPIQIIIYSITTRFLCIPFYLHRFSNYIFHNVSRIATIFIMENSNFLCYNIMYILQIYTYCIYTISIYLSLSMHLSHHVLQQFFPSTLLSIYLSVYLSSIYLSIYTIYIFLSIFMSI